MQYRMNVVKSRAGNDDRVHYQVQGGDGILSPASRVIHLRPGLILNILSVMPSVDAKSKFEIGQAPIQFGFIVSGMNRCTYRDGMLKNQVHVLQPGSNGIYYLPQTSGVIESDRTAGVGVVSILATAAFLEEYFRKASNGIPVSFKNVLREKDDQFQWRGKMRPYKMAMLAQITSRSYTGPLQKLFLESRVLELMACQLEEYLGTSPGEAGRRQNLAAADIERIRAARQLLVKDFENPPSVAMLARAVGINEKKLKYGFKQVYSLPIFEYFRDYRLEKAREMLASGAMTVTEAAYNIGYLSLSHFSRAFRERYGVNPRDYTRLRSA